LKSDPGAPRRIPTWSGIARLFANASALFHDSQPFHLMTTASRLGKHIASHLAALVACLLEAQLELLVRRDEVGGQLRISARGAQCERVKALVNLAPPSDEN